MDEAEKTEDENPDQEQKNTGSMRLSNINYKLALL